MSSTNELRIQYFNDLQPYEPIWQAMREFTDERDEDTFDEIWLMQHQPVFTLGQAGKSEHILNPHAIPVVQSDRGGQVTYHGPGQLMVYTLINLKRLDISTREFVRSLERCIVSYLDTLGIKAANNPKAPGVYVDGAKICSIGLRVRKGSSYHGLAFNVDMNLTPFSYINPCGFSNLPMTQLASFTRLTQEQVIDGLLPLFAQEFGYKLQLDGITKK
jgi:lipoyl(octanoyl) transferase